MAEFLSGFALFALPYTIWWVLAPIKTVWVDTLDANARNWPHKIVMRRGLKFPRAVWAQERYEAMKKRNPIWGIGVRFIPEMRRRLEYMGHEVEVQTEYLLGGNEDQARRREADALAAGYDGIFDSFDRAVLIAQMLARRKKARRWVRKHWGEITLMGEEK